MASTSKLDEALPAGSLKVSPILTHLSKPFRHAENPSYPSNCLAFLNSPPTIPSIQTAQVRWNMIIVGAGLGGLATAIALASTGHTVTIYEQAAELGEV